MTPVEAASMGALQGATEFLPISSSGHLRLAQSALGARPPSILFDIALHVGTLVAVVVVFRRDLFELVRGLRPQGDGVRWLDQPAVRSLIALVIASVPTALLGLTLEPIIEDDFAVHWVGALLLINGGVLLLTRGRGGGEAAPIGADWGIGWRVAIVIGIAQGLAVLPGISRSGATIATALLCGVSWRPAAAFSFVLSIPAILGALVLKIGDAGAFSDDTAAVAIGVGMAIAVGLVCLTMLLGALRKAQFHQFAWYCFALGGVALVWGLVG